MLSELGFQELVENTRAQAGLDVAPRIRVDAKTKLAQVAAFRSRTNGLDIFVICPFDEQQPISDIEYLKQNKEPFTARGLLDASVQELTVPSGPPAEEETHLVYVATLSAPETINETHSYLGRFPGKDVFKLVRRKGQGNCNGGKWIDGIAQKEIWVADISSPFFAIHDLDPGNHIQAWTATPEMLTSTYANKAQSLIDTYGDEIYGEEDDELKVTHDFVLGIEEIVDLTKPLFEKMFKFDRLGARHEAEMIKSLHWHISDAGSNKNIDKFANIGAINEDHPTIAPVEQMQFIASAYIAQIARHFMVVEDVIPMIGTSKREHAQRLDMWSRVVGEFTELAVPFRPHYG